MRLLASIALAAGVAFSGTAPAAATEASPFPVCRDIHVGRTWVGEACVDPSDPCVVYGGGTLWQMCFDNPL